MIYKIIDTNLNQCINAIEWNGIEFNSETGIGWSVPNGQIAIQSNIINIGDSVQLVDGVYQRV